jgi:hypothetical protein
MMVITYQLNLLGLKGPRRLKIYLSKNNTCIKINKNDNIVKHLKSNKDIQVYKNKMPTLSESKIN